MSKQNIYDNSEFFASYKTLRENDLGFNSKIEQPALRSLLPSLQGKTVLDLGCGMGNFCRFAAGAGAKEVLGVDISEKMLEIAREKTSRKNIVYLNTDIEDFNYQAGHFDIVTSSVSFHYIAVLDSVFRQVNRVMRQKGAFIFSVEHPICTANPNVKTTTMEGETVWIVENYRDEKQFQQTWFVENVQKYHRTISSYLNQLIELGFRIDRVLEPMPDDELISKNQSFAIHKTRPPLLVISAIKV